MADVLLREGDRARVMSGWGIGGVAAWMTGERVTVVSVGRTRAEIRFDSREGTYRLALDRLIAELPPPPPSAYTFEQPVIIP